MSLMRERIVELEKRRAEIKLMGGEKRVAKQHGRGKLTARERLDRFFDDAAFTAVLQTTEILQEGRSSWVGEVHGSESGSLALVYGAHRRAIPRAMSGECPERRVR